MRITIDNHDGRGALDYTGAVAVEGPLKIQRTLNAPSRCTAELVTGLHGLPTPSRRARVVVSSDNGRVLFTGYLAMEPTLLYAGLGAAGPSHRAQLNAISDEWLLDKQSTGMSGRTNGLALSTPVSSVVGQLTENVLAGQGTSTLLSVTSTGNPRAIGAFAVQPAAGWSTNAAAAANAAYSAYNVLNGAVTVTPAGTVVHTLDENDGTLNLAAFNAGYVRELANDITVSGTEEATTYVQEIFQGDGVTTDFFLSSSAYRDAHRDLIRDQFDQAALDTSQWKLTDPGSHLGLSGAGLLLSGGNGLDGQTTLQAVNSVEMTGFLLAELSGVVFGAASNGVLAGFYDGDPVLTNCLAGFHVRQSVSTTGGVTVLVPVIEGVEAGTTYTPTAGHTYTLRLRLYCPEMQRVAQRYYCMVDGAVQGFGSIDGVDAPIHLVFEIVDEGVSSNTSATVLFDTAWASTAVQSTSAMCSFVAVNSVSLFGSMKSISLTRPGSLWVTSTMPNGTQATRLTGAIGQGVDCMVEYGSTAGVPGKVSFFAGRVPVAGERLTICYRKQKRAVARLVDPDSVQAETTAGEGSPVPGLSRWLGRVIAPVARSSADCEAAAEAILAMATARSAALSGTYSSLNPAEDMWPGDVLQVTSSGTTNSLLLRSVEIQDGHAVPEVLQYKTAFANDWASEWSDGLGLKLSDAIASDATLPTSATPGASQYLSNLQQVSVTMLSSTAVQVDAGVNAPAGGGFEVRRRDWDFGTGLDAADLVLRSPVRSFSIPRTAQKEHFFVRMYDGSSPPLYSRFSSALFLNWPTS